MLGVLIVDDHDIARVALSALAEWAPDTAVVGPANSRVEAVRRASELVPEIVIMDVEMPDVNRLEAAQIIEQNLPAVCMVFMSGPGEGEQAPEAARSRGRADSRRRPVRRARPPVRTGRRGRRLRTNGHESPRDEWRS